MHKRGFLLFIVPLLVATLNCATVTSRLPFASTATPIAPPTPTVELSQTPVNVSDLDSTFTYAPALVYRDVDWAIEMDRFSEAELAPPASPRQWGAGDRHTFLYSDANGDREVEMELRYLTPHFYMWFEDGSDVATGDIAWAAEQAEAMYPGMRAIFGAEASPGVDGDPHLFVLHLKQLSNDVYGEYGASDECPTDVCSYSNGHEILYITLDGPPVGSDEYMGILVHEFQHAIRSNTDGNDSHWQDEGLSMLAEVLSGYEKLAADFVPGFLANPDLQLNAWPMDNDDLSNYGASYLFMLYLYEQFGEGLIRDLAQQPHDDMLGVVTTLEQHTDLTLAEVVRDWTIANLLDDNAFAEGRFGYAAEKLPSLTFTDTHSEFPLERASLVHQFAADYIALNLDQPMRLSFAGELGVPLLPVTAHSGHRFWWSNRLDSSQAALQTTLDLTGLTRPRVKFWMWHDTEPEWDVVMAQVSRDGGRSWEIVRGEHSQRDDWWDYEWTGLSGGEDPAAWVQEEIDLNSWAGESVLLRFQYVTDGFATGRGFALDDFQLEGAAGVVREWDFESGAEGWEAAGFVHLGDTLRQQWAVTLVTLGGVPLVQPVAVDEGGQAEIDIPSDGKLQRHVLVVTALTPFTLESAHYTYRVTPLP